MLTVHMRCRVLDHEFVVSRIARARRNPFLLEEFHPERPTRDPSRFETFEDAIEVLVDRVIEAQPGGGE